MRSVIFSQCRDRRMGVVWLKLGALTTARAREFWICWSRVIWDLGRVESCSSQAWSEQWKWRWWKLFWYRGMDGYSKAGENGKARFWDRRNLVRKSEVFIKYEAKVSSRVSSGERRVVDFGKLVEGSSHAENQLDLFICFNRTAACDRQTQVPMLSVTWAKIVWNT